jgi:ATP-binding cassette subfamily F protein 1
MAMEKSLRMKAEALRDDENVFDVSFEGMGTVEATASATDVKVGDNVLNTATASLVPASASASAVRMHLWHLGPTWS